MDESYRRARAPEPCGPAAPSAVAGAVGQPVSARSCRPASTSWVTSASISSWANSFSPWRRNSASRALLGLIEQVQQCHPRVGHSRGPSSGWLNAPLGTTRWPPSSRRPRIYTTSELLQTPARRREAEAGADDVESDRGWRGTHWNSLAAGAPRCATLSGPPPARSRHADSLMVDAWTAVFPDRLRW